MTTIRQLSIQGCICQGLGLLTSSSPLRETSLTPTEDQKTQLGVTCEPQGQVTANYGENSVSQISKYFSFSWTSSSDLLLEVNHGPYSEFRPQTPTFYPAAKNQIRHCALQTEEEEEEEEELRSRTDDGDAAKLNGIPAT